MKSERARAFLDRKSPNRVHPVSGAVTYGLLSRYDADRAVELAEQETEETMRDKAIKAFCAAICPKGCFFGADGNIGCGEKARFIQKMNDDENN